MNYGNYDNNNQYSTSYGAAGGADGGGFMAGEPQSSQAGGKGGYGKDTVRPMTIKQILDAQQPHPDAEFKSDGETFAQVTFVGQIRSISTQPTNITYKIDDGTGLIEAKQWIDATNADSDNTSKMDVDSSKSKLVEDGYCRVWGRLKAFNNKRHVGAHIIRPVTDMNEVNYHFLEATAVHLFFTRGPPPNANGAQSKPNANANNGTLSRQDQSSASDGHLSHVSPLARRIFSTLKNTPQSNEGLHVQMIASTMGIGTNDVYKGAEELVAAGVIFTTVDDHTWAVLDT